jgi:hypothetical protein
MYQFFPQLCFRSEVKQARTGRGIHGLPKVSCGPAMPDPAGERPAAIFFPFGYPFPYGPGSRPVFHAVSMDSLKYWLGPPCPTILGLEGSQPATPEMVSRREA